jgi:GWxTD domain-containing protein
MRRHTVSLAGLVLFAAALCADTPPQLFAKAKEQFRLASYADALKTLEKLEQVAGAPEFEKDRVALLPALSFYKGASLAALGRTGEALAHLEIFLTYQPNVSLDPGIYPKKVVAALEEARRSLSKKAAAPWEEKDADSLRLAYQAFRVQEPPEPVSLGEDWSDGPVRLLLTPEERRDFLGLSDSVSRSEFVTAFWKAKDPKPETPENEFREEFERRVAFSDARFTQEETVGSQTDRGMVFILLGPPTYAGRAPLRTGEDTADPAGLKRYRAADVRIAALPGGSTSQRAARIDAVTGPGVNVNEAAANWREVWHYRREHLPKEVPFLQVDFEFVTKRGYGQNVLQRESTALTTLERARTQLRRPG